jgi:hypothetical protein
MEEIVAELLLMHLPTLEDPVEVALLEEEVMEVPVLEEMVD